MDRFTRSFITGSVPVLTLFVAAQVHAGGLNTNVALSPPAGGTIVRAQWRYSKLSDDKTPLDREVKLSINPVTVVHGATENLTILGTVPIVHREIDFGSGIAPRNDRDTGAADIPLLAKYRFYQHDEPGITSRWAAIAGVEVPTYDEPFSSKSIDPIIGTVWTHQRRDDWWLDWDVLYKFNTGGGIDSDDELRGDVALSYRLIDSESGVIGPCGLYAIGEINAKYITDGSTQVLGAPGVQFISSRWILEAGVQLPIHQQMASPRLETDFTIIFSLRFQF